MRITAKGQVTIPQEVRHKMGMLPGSEVEFVEDADRVYIRKAKGSTRGQRLVAHMRGGGDVRMSTDEILALTRGRK